MSPPWLHEELLRLQVLLALWPTEPGREEFKTELHLKGALQEAYDKAFPEERKKETCPHCEGAGRAVTRPPGGGIIQRRQCEACCGTGYAPRGLEKC